MSAEEALFRLTRYESLFELSSEINAANEIARVGDVMAGRLKYVADIFSWRHLTLEQNRIGSLSDEISVMAIDGYRGAARITQILYDQLSSVELELCAARKTCFLTEDMLAEAKKQLPEQFQKNDIIQLFAYPHFGEGELRALSIFSRRRQVLSELDIKFVTLAAQFFHEKVYALWEQRKLRDLEQAYLRQEMMMRQKEKLATLGQLSAGVAHELNNPASAASRGTDQLREAIKYLEQISSQAAQLSPSPERTAFLQKENERIHKLAKTPLELDPLAQSDLEYEIENWLEAQGVDDAWSFAPTLVNMGYTIDKLTTLTSSFSQEEIRLVVQLLSHRYTVYRVLEEISHGTSRIAQIVKALKSYSYMDQAPTQSVDIHEGINDTLIMLGGKLKTGIQVKKYYDPDLPRIEAFGSELNQVWTNIIDNAIAAMDGHGEIHIKTSHTPNYVVVEITDNGPGIPSQIQDKIFDPFFTTKAPGKGIGLGLNLTHNIITQKHYGHITLASKPGETRFTVKLPLNYEEFHLDEKD